MEKPKSFLLRPRYLRAVPSLVVLTTAMAWGMAQDPDAANTAGSKAGLMQLQDAGRVGGPPLGHRWLWLKGR